MSDEEINLQTMSDDEIYELMKEDLYDGYAEEVVEEVNVMLERGHEP